MKISFKYIAIALIAVLVSCDDAKDIEQAGTITEETAYESVDDLQLGLSGAYAGYGMNGLIQFNAVFTDNIRKGSDNLGQNKQLFQWTLNTNTSIANIWDSRYAAINRVNRVLRGIENLEIPAERQAEADRIKGQMLALRALCHFDLLEYYAEDYQAPQSPGVPIIDFVPPVDINAERNTVGESFDFIYDDLDNAMDLLEGESTDDQFYINENGVEAIKARVALFRGDYELAGNLADDLVSKYPLATPEQYENVYKDEGFDEVIFSLARGQGDSQIGGVFYFNGPSLSGSPIIEMSRGLYNQYSEDDVRYGVNVIEGDLDLNNNIIPIGKYPGSVEPLVNDVKLFRSSEMLLIRAEAEARGEYGSLADAEGSIDQLLNARYTTNVPATPSYSSTEEALNAIVEQRRLEFSFEGHRFLDIKRLGEELNLDITRIPEDCNSFSGSSECTLPRSDYRFTFPIPNTELNANPNIEQNTGY